MTKHDHVFLSHCRVEGMQEDMVEVTEMAVLTGGYDISLTDEHIFFTVVIFCGNSYTIKDQYSSILCQSFPIFPFRFSGNRGRGQGGWYSRGRGRNFCYSN